MKTAAASIVLLAAFSLTGCARRQMTITSEPSGAMVYLNDREVGRTPFTTDFLWYGNYDVQLRKDGYETLTRHTNLVAPLWGWPPFDLFAEMNPSHPTDHRDLNYVMKERADEPTSELVARGVEFKSRLSTTATQK